MKKKIINDDDISLATRSIDVTGKNIYDEALKLRINTSLIKPMRVINVDVNNCWVNNVKITDTYYPIQVRKDIYNEIRFRSIGISCGSGSNVVVFDNEIGDILYLISGYTCKITSLSLSIPQKIKKLVPLIVTGDNDGYIKTY